MIPVEHQAAGTARLAALTAELEALDSAWLELHGDFDRLAALIQEKQAAGCPVGQALAELCELDGKLIAVEQQAVRTMGGLTLALVQAANG